MDVLILTVSVNPDCLPKIFLKYHVRPFLTNSGMSQLGLRDKSLYSTLYADRSRIIGRTLGSSDFRSLRFSKMDTFLPIRYIFMSSIKIQKKLTKSQRPKNDYLFKNFLYQNNRQNGNFGNIFLKP